jgi:AcrR family transcriptional regulator
MASKTGRFSRDRRGDLPRGPHSLSREQVTESQRQRLVAAMIDAVGEHGYAKTTVAEVIGRAGVSRKAFYQHFANKQDCFLETHDAVVAEGVTRITSAYLEGEDPSDSARSGIEALFQWAIENPSALRLALVEISAAGRAGIARREQLLAALEQLLREGLALSPGPNPVLRAVIGGLNRVLYTRVQNREYAELLGLVPDLVRWVTSYYPAPSAMMSLQEHRQGRSRPPASLVGGRAPGALSPLTIMSERRGLVRGESRSRSFVVHSQLERILDAVANLTTRNGYTGLTAESIAEEAAVSLQAFYTHFTDKEDAFLVAYEIGQNKCLAIVQRAYAAEPDWRDAVRAGIAALFDFLASEPSFAHISLVGALTATPRTADRYLKAMVPFAHLLAPGLEEAEPARRPPAVTIEAISTGIFELCFSHALRGRIGALPDMLPAAAYFALAPFIGAEQAARVATAPSEG